MAAQQRARHQHDPDFARRRALGLGDRGRDPGAVGAGQHVTSFRTHRRLRTIRRRR